MEKIIFAGQDKCTGCGACATVCPVNAIEMVSSNEGFVYPALNTSYCIQCGKCQKVCPIFREKRQNTSSKICGLIHSDKSVWKKSTSGGAFTAICQIYGDRDTVIFGVTYNPSMRRAEHTYVVGIESVSIFCGSKYVQSSLGNSFVEVAEFLKQGKRVIFTGTPCQISGLKQTLHNVNTENLLCVALMCNGVSSPSVFEQYVVELEKRYGSSITEYKFRDKKILLGMHHLYRRTIISKNQRSKSSCNDLFNKCYTPKILCRTSCFNCDYGIENIESDLTIGDFKKMYHSVPNAPFNMNGSVVISHTAKGDTVFEKLSKVSQIYDITFDDVDYPKSSNGDIKKRNAFFNEFEKTPETVISLLKKYAPKTTYKQRLGRFFPDKLKVIIKKRLGEK